MITISKRVKIFGGSKKIVFDAENLPDGEYDVQLLIGDKEKISSDEDYDLANWSSGIVLDPLPSFRREEMYGEDGR